MSAADAPFSNAIRYGTSKDDTLRQSEEAAEKSLVSALSSFFTVWDEVRSGPMLLAVRRVSEKASLAVCGAGTESATFSSGASSGF